MDSSGLGARRHTAHERNQYDAAGVSVCGQRRNDVTRCNGIDMPPYGPLCGNTTSFINRKYITYRNAASRGPSYGKFGEDWICRLLSFHDRRQTHTLVTIFPTAEQSDRIKRKLSIVATSTACSTTISAHNRRSTHISSRCIAPLWNSLPADIRSSPSLPVFRQRLKTCIFRQSFPIT